MIAAAEIEAAFAAIPTIKVAEVVRIVTPQGEYDAEELFKGVFEGSRTFSYTDAEGVGRIIRVKA